MKIYPDENSLLKQFTNNNNEIVIDNTNEQYQKYIIAPRKLDILLILKKLEKKFRLKIKNYLKVKMKISLLEIKARFY